MSFRAVRVTKSDAGQSVAFADVEDAELMDGDVTVRVTHSTVNYKDGLALSGKSAIPRKFPLLLGIDFAGVVDAQSRAELEDYASRVEQATGAQLAFVTVQSLNDEPIEDVTNDIFHAWGVGERTKDNGLMVLLSVGDRKSRLEVGGGLGGETLLGAMGVLPRGDR